jgi:putative phosphoesterase
VRIALLADTHGNSIAMDAVLADLERVEPDETVFLGDAAANGFDPAGALERLRRLDPRTVMGNTDADILDTPDFYFPPRREQLPVEAQKVLEISLWGHDQLDETDRQLLRSFSDTVEVELPGERRVLCFHGSPQSATDVMTATTPDDEARSMLGSAGTDLLAGGHTHVPLLRRTGQQTFINPGSVGLPFARYGTAGTVPLLPHAQYAVMDASEERVTVRFEQVPLDVGAIRDAALERGMPHAEWWAGLWVDGEPHVTA